MPGLRLTREQAQRLWGLDEATCVEVLEFLAEVKFLQRSDAGLYARCGEGAVRVPELRMAKANLRHSPVSTETRARR